MKKRVFSVILMLCMLCALLPVGVPSVWAYSDTDIAYPVEGGNIYFDKETGTITACDLSVTRVDIPEQIDGKEVKIIGTEAFKNHTNLEQISIPRTLTAIEAYAFSSCSALRAVHISDLSAYCAISFKDTVFGHATEAWLTDPGWGNYYLGDTLIEDLVIPDGVTAIENHAFAYAKSITSVTIPEGVTSIGEDAFLQCTNLTEVTIPSTVTRIGASAFQYCPALQDVYICDIAAWCAIDFALTYEFSSYFPKSNPLYYADNLYICGELTTDIVIPDQVTDIGYAFSGSGITSIRIGNGVTRIVKNAFSGCNKLISVTIGNSVTDIDRDAFQRCDQLKEINVNEMNANYSSENGLLLNKARTEFICCPGGYTGHCTIPGGVIKIGDYAFSDCSSLTSVTIPDSVTGIGGAAFYNCSSLTDVTIPQSVISIGAEAFGYTGCYMDKSNWHNGAFYLDHWLLAVEYGEINGNYTILNGTVGIADYALSSCESLTSLTLPDGLTSIGAGAFSCSGLTGVMIPSSVTEIYHSAFRGCESLGNVTIPKGVTIIADWLFSDCRNLTNVTIPDSVTSIGYEAFQNCDSLTSVLIPSGVRSIGERAFDSCKSMRSVTIPNSVTDISSEAFRNCDSLTSVIIPNSVVSIGRAAFCLSDSLTSVYFWGDAPVLGENVFQTWDWETISYINIPDLKLYYIEGKDGWTTPTWNGYPTETWLPEHEHSYMATVTPPTCTERGFTTHTCTIYGESYVDTYVEALGHEFGESTQIKAATCINKGEEKYICSRCDAYEIRETAALGHHYENNCCVRCGEKDPNAQPPVEFGDVPPNEWYVGAVEYAVQNGLMNGVGNDQFDPEGSMTRAMLVTVLWRYEGEPEAGKNPFTDVPNGQWYTEAVAWAAANGIVGGVGNNQFEPEGKITREQMATILYRYAEKKGIDTSKRGDLSGFPDGGKTASWAKNAVQWAVAEGIINGSDGKLLPQGNATRAQVATILMRFIENIVKK